MILKKLREIVDSSQGNSNSNNNKEKMQAISLIMECYTKKTEFFDAKPIVDGFKEIVDQTKKSEQETKQREKRIQDYIANANLTQKEIDTITTTGLQAGYCPS